MKSPYNPSNWYWAVGGSATQVFSSAAFAYVPVSDATYAAWCALGNVPTSIDTWASLWQVLVNAEADPATATVNAGVQITSTSTPALNGTYMIDVASQGKITSEQVYIAQTGKFTNGQTTRGWIDITGAIHIFPSTAEFSAFAEAAAGYVDAIETAAYVAQTGGGWVAPPQPGPIT